MRTTEDPKAERINIRATASEKLQLLELAKRHNQSLSEYMLTKSLKPSQPNK